MKLRKMEVVIDQDALLVDIDKVICNLDNVLKEYAYVLHNKDLGRPHYHIYLNFYPNFVTTESIANLFQLGDMYSARSDSRELERYIYKVDVSSQDMLLYFLRFGEYQIEEIVTNIDCSFLKLKKSRKK